MTIPEVGEIAIHQMYRKCVVEIGDSRQYGKIRIKEKPWLRNHDFSIHICYFIRQKYLPVLHLRYKLLGLLRLHY